MILHLGVIDIPHSQPSPPPALTKRGKIRKSVGKAMTHGVRPSITTGELAELLEERYHIMRIFFELHDKDVAGDMEHGLGGALETVLMGGPIDLDAFGSATSKIADRMKRFLSEREIEQLGYPGIPTKAALMGVRHRFRQPFKGGRGPRESFIDTGQYQSTMMAWVT